MDGLTSDGEAQKLLGILKQKGQNGVVSAMEDMKDKGRVAPTGTVGTGMHFVRMRPNKLGGFHIVLATNRPITFAELYNSTRSRDYPPGIVVLEVDKDGKGTGTLAPPARSASTKRTNLRSNITGRSPSASPTSIAKSNFTQPSPPAVHDRMWSWHVRLCAALFLECGSPAYCR